MNYSYGSYNKSDSKEQWVRLTEGCPNNCSFCYEPLKQKVFKMPKIIRNKVKIMDMNLLSKPESLEMIKELGLKRVNNKVVYYELICGVDHRFLTPEIAEALKKSRFKKIRIAWDFGFEYQYKMKDTVNILKKAGYRGTNIMVFMICNWKTPHETNLRKIDLCKVWGVQVSDCWFDNQLSPNIKPIYWNEINIKSFRRKCRKHNQLVTFQIDPEFKK